MQVLKDEIRKNILSSAKELFYLKGYNNASIRDITKKAGITVGNVYRYFDNKESILEGIVQPVYIRIMDFIKFSEKLLEQGRNKSFNDFRSIINRSIIDISREFRLELLILFTRTKGTRFEKTREDLISVIENMIYEGLFKKNNLQYGEAVFLSKIVARTFLDGLFMVVSEMDNSESLEKMIYLLNDFYYNHLDIRFETKS